MQLQRNYPSKSASQSQSTSQAPRKKRRNRVIKINNDTYLEGLWTAKVERGRTCQKCRQPISAGSPSLRYIRKDLKYGKYSVVSEKAICPECAIPMLEKMLDELKQPIDKQMYMRMKKNQPSPQTTW